VKTHSKKSLRLLKLVTVKLGDSYGCNQPQVTAYGSTPKYRRRNNIIYLSTQKKNIYLSLILYYIILYYIIIYYLCPLYICPFIILYYLYIIIFSIIDTMKLQNPAYGATVFSYEESHLAHGARFL